MLTFLFTQSDVNGQSRQEVRIPLLSLVPQPLLQVKEADFDFDIQIVDAVKEEREGENAAGRPSGRTRKPASSDS